MAIDRPGIGSAGARKQRCITRRDGSPVPEGAIHVHPGACFLRTGADFSCRIKGARVHVARLNTDECAVIERGQRLWPHPSLGVGWNPRYSRTPQTEHG